MAEIVRLNVGGVAYATTLTTLQSVKDSLIASYFKDGHRGELPKDSEGRYFIDRDGVLFRYVLDFMRNKKLILPEHFAEKQRLIYEAEYYRLPELAKLVYIKSVSPGPAAAGANHALPSMQTSMTRSITNTDVSDRTGCITIGYRGTFAFGREGLVDVKFRKVMRILVCGKVTLCRSVFGETLNESRDPDRGNSERYSARFYLKHSFIEQAFDMLIDAGFTLRAACGTGTNSIPIEGLQNTAKGPQLQQVASAESEEGRWYHYNEFVWVKEDVTAM